MIGPSRFNESCSFHIENLAIEIGNLWIGVHEMLIDSAVIVPAKHFIFLINILLIFIDFTHQYPHLIHKILIFINRYDMQLIIGNYKKVNSCWRSRRTYYLIVFMIIIICQARWNFFIWSISEIDLQLVIIK